jgi:diguanylate cyclase (GGDEF)-like protein
MSELKNLIENSRINEAIAKKLFDIETEILSCQSSNELLKRLLDLIKEKFQLTNVALLLIEPTPLPYLLSSNMRSSWHQENCRSIAEHILPALHADNKPFLTNNLPQLAQAIPAKLLANANSAAIIPLNLAGKLFGSLLFTDEDKERFTPQLGTFHLEQLSVKVSLCLSNALIREQLEHMANYDRLTGVANRRLMENSIKKELTRQRRYNVPFSIIFIDCNKFKLINDTYGHDCGDKVLVYVASQLEELIRDNDKCFRYAGDEFVITLAGQDNKDAQKVVRRLTLFFTNHPMPYGKESLAITISCGVAASDGSQTMEQLLKQADEQLYLHKKVRTSAT